MLCQQGIAGHQGGRLPPVALFWLLILGEVGTLFWKRDYVPAPREGMCSTQPPREPGSGQRDRETPETNVLPTGFREEGKTDFSPGLRGTAQGLLQTKSLVEPTKGKPRGWDLPCKAMDGKEETCLHLIWHSRVSLHKNLIFQVKHSLRELRLSWWFWVFMLDPPLSLHWFVVNQLSQVQWFAIVGFHYSMQLCYSKESCFELREGMISLCLGDKDSLFLVLTFCMGILWSLRPVTGHLGTFLTDYWGIPGRSWPERIGFLEMGAELAYFFNASCRKWYYSVQVIMSDQAVCCSITDQLLHPRSFQIISPCQAQYILKHLDLFCTLRVSFELLTTCMRCVAEQSNDVMMSCWRCRLSVQ